MDAVAMRFEDVCGVEDLDGFDVEVVDPQYAPPAPSTGEDARRQARQVQELAEKAAEAAKAMQMALEGDFDLTEDDLKLLEKARAEEAARKTSASRAASRARKPRAAAASGSSTSSAAAVGAKGSTRSRRARRAVAAGAVASDVAKPAETTKARRRRTPPGGLSTTTDSVRIYLKDIGKHKLLNAEEEIELSLQIQDLLVCERSFEALETDLGRPPNDAEWAAALEMESEEELDHRLKKGRMAKNRMVNANLRLVVSIAKKYLNRGMTFQDLIQEGSIGLIRGAEKFDPSRGYKFSTYAHWWIRQAVTRSIADQSRTIRLPVHLFEIMSRIKKQTKQLQTDLGRTPVDEEVAEAMGMPVKKLQAIYKAAQLPLSLESPMGGGSSKAEGEVRTLEETIEDQTMETPEDTAARRLLQDDLDNVLSTLNVREHNVLRLRYGLDDGRVKTLEEIGSRFKVTRERIRQIEAKALRKLRQPSRNAVLCEYLDQ